MTTSDKYATLTALMLECIGDRTVPFSTLIANKPLIAEADRIAAEENAARGILESHTKAIPGWRVVDRRLQALRKRGLIAYMNKGWACVGAIR